MGFRERYSIPDLGVGVGFRNPHYDAVLDQHPAMDWFEIVSERFMVKGGRPLEHLDKLRSHYKVVPHGVSLSIGGSGPLDQSYLARLKALIDRIKPPWASDHFCWCGTGKADLHDLLPLPLTKQTIRHIADRVRRVQDMLGLPFALENASTYLTFSSSTMPEWEFVAAVAEEADCGLLLDVNNVFVSAHNHGFDPIEYIDAIPADRVVQMHLAGHTDMGTHLLDTHSAHVRSEVWELFRYAIRRMGPTSILIEWDEDIPSWDVLALEAATARGVRDEVLALPRAAFPETPCHERAAVAAGVRIRAEALPDIQHFMGPALMRKAPIRDDPALAERAGQIIAKGLRLSPIEQIEIYREMYWIRHTRGLETNFVATLYAVGHQGFHALSESYFAAHPPAFVSIRELGHRLPQFVKDTAPWSQDPLVADCAELDWAFLVAMDAADAPPLDPQSISNAPPEAWAAAKLFLHPSVQHFVLAHPAHRYRARLRSGERPERPAPKRTHAVVSREPDGVHCRPLPALAFKLLDLIAGGAPLAEASAEIATRKGLAGTSEVAAEVGGWIQNWLSFGWICRVEF